MDTQTLDTGSLRELIHIPKTPCYLYPVQLSVKAMDIPRNCKNPQLILLCSWTDAAPRHIMKYMHAYRNLYPTSPILLVRTSSSDFFLNSERALQQRLEPAIRIIRAHLEDEPSSGPNEGFLAHALSNGGSGHLTCLARQYHATTGHPLPVDVLILDSTPTRARFKSILAGLSVALPSPVWIRLPMRILLMILVFLAYVIPRRLGLSTMADRVYDDLISLETLDNSGRKSKEWLRKEAVRSYIYSEADDICLAKDIIPHVEEAARRGMPIRNEVWVGSGHVGHMKLDPERYWKVVKETWEGRN